MKHIKKYLSLLLVAVMTVSTLTLVACTPQGDDHTEEQTQNVLKSSLSLQTQDSAFIKLSASAPTRSATNANVIEHTLTATVLPETAENKQVDWSVAWAQTANTSNVEDYVTVTPQSDGSNVATVACLQPFAGNVIITVTTREGGFTAQCICKYVGIPSTIEVDLSDATIVTDNDWSTKIMEIGGDTASYHSISLSNIFGEPGADFTPKYDIVMEAHGGILTTNTTYDAQGNLTGTEQVEVPLQTIDFFDTAGYYSAYFFGEKSAVNFIFVGIREGQLYVNGLNYPEAYHWEKTYTDGTTTNSVFHSFMDGKEPYVTVTLTEKTTGITYTFNVRTVGMVNQVNLDYEEIIF